MKWCYQYNANYISQYKYMAIFDSGSNISYERYIWNN